MNYIGVQKNTRLKRVKKLIRFEKIIHESKYFFHSFYSRKKLYTVRECFFYIFFIVP